MNPFKSILEFFNIDKNDRKGFIFLIGLLLLITIVNYFLQNQKPEVSVIVYKNQDGKVTTSEKSYPDRVENGKEEVSNTSETSIGKHLFNPNTATFKDLTSNGFDNKTAYTLIHYRDKGAVFRYKEDIKKVYGISEGLYTSLIHYIDLPNKGDKNTSPKYIANNKAGGVGEESSSNGYSPSVREKEMPFQPVEINSADTGQLIKLKGIGPFYAKKIIDYRTRLGGFIKKDQLLEVWGLDSEKYNLLLPQIELDKSKLIKISINTITLNQLKKHPYMNWKEANAIINYRKQHGRFSSMYDVEKIILLSDETLIKMYPYISFE